MQEHENAYTETKKKDERNGNMKVNNRAFKTNIYGYLFCINFSVPPLLISRQ